MEAQEHADLMEKEHLQDICESLAYGKEYRGALTTNYRKLGNPVVKIYEGDVVRAVNDTQGEENVAVLNFADYRHPGGLFLRGSHAQEETLCWSGTLFNVLREYENDYYARNKATNNKGLYTDAALYNPHILIGKKYVSVITCAAPNRQNLCRYGSFTEEQNLQSLESRAKFVLDVAEDNNVDVLFLGAWGCGVFKQNPRTIAETFKKYLDTGDYGFKEVHFPITDYGMCVVFKRVFSNS